MEFENDAKQDQRFFICRPRDLRDLQSRNAEHRLLSWRTLGADANAPSIHR